MATSFTSIGSLTFAAGAAGSIISAYQQGTWTPGISFGGGTTGITYSAQTGVYTQIGNILIAGFNVSLSNKGSSTGDARVTGLPVSMGTNAHQFTCVLGGGLVTLTAGYSVLLARGTTSATTLDITQFGTGVGYIVASNTHFANTSGISGTIVYTTA